jgi:hypothetical protein
VIAALKAAKLTPNRADNAVMSRGALSPLMRTEMRGSRLFKVDRNARNTMQALASGYNWPVKPNGERAGEPERGSARTLMEAIECLTNAINKANNTNHIEKPNAQNASGRPYLSALKR